MVRRIATIWVMAVMGFMAFGGVAVAYPADGVPAVSVEVNAVGVGATVEITGSGFLPGEIIDVSVSYAAALRSPQSISIRSKVSALGDITGTADAQGNFSIPLTMSQRGVATIRAVGLTSGNVSSLTVRVGLSDAGTADTSGTGAAAAPAANDTAGDVKADQAGDDTAARADTAQDTSDLAYTGTAIAGPLTMGVAAIVVGVALLVFGIRLTSRRRHNGS